jgi:ATP-binding cassette subfamily F protein 3
MLSDANFLLLDEPTNNLDLSSREVLENALDEFAGTVLVISHDRYFLDRVVDRIVEVEEGALAEYPGDYTYFREEKARRAAK